MKLSKKYLQAIIIEEAKNLLNSRKIEQLKLNEPFKQEFIAGIVSLLADDQKNIHSEWAFEVFEPKLKEKFGIKPIEAAILLQYMKNSQEISNNFYDNLKSVLIQLSPKITKILDDPSSQKKQLKNLRNPVPMGQRTTIPD